MAFDKHPSAMTDRDHIDQLRDRVERLESAVGIPSAPQTGPLVAAASDPNAKLAEPGEVTHGHVIHD